MKQSALKIPIDFAQYAPSNKSPIPKYGLPSKVRFCIKCGVSNQRPNSAVEFKHNAESKKHTIGFNEKGICDACKMAEAKSKEIDWDERRYLLQRLCDKHRSRNGSFDCLVPGSGGKDSFYQTWKLKYEFGMNPLTVTWAPNIYTKWGWSNFQSWIHSGFHNFLFTPSGHSMRLLTRLAIENLFHPFQPFMIGQKCFAPKMAAKFNIPLIFYGENEAEYGNPLLDNASAKRSSEYFSTAADNQIFLAGESIDNLKTDFGMNDSDLEPFLPIDSRQLESSETEVHYLGYYLKWHPQETYYFAIKNGNFTPSPERTAGTYSKYVSIDDKMDDFHYYTTFIKFGIGRATSDASQEVRSGDLDIEEAKALIRKYDGEFPDRWTKELFAYLSIDKTTFPIASKCFEHPEMNQEYFTALTDSFRSPHLWMLEEDNWKLRHKL